MEASSIGALLHSHVQDTILSMGNHGEDTTDHSDYFDIASKAAQNLCTYLKNYLLYSKEHNSTLRISAQLLESLSRAFEHHDSVTFELHPRHIAYMGAPAIIFEDLDGNPLRDLLSDLVESLIFARGVSKSELEQFAHVLTTRNFSSLENSPANLLWDLDLANIRMKFQDVSSKSINQLWKGLGVEDAIAQSLAKLIRDDEEFYAWTSQYRDAKFQSENIQLLQDFSRTEKQKHRKDALIELPNITSDQLATELDANDTKCETIFAQALLSSIQSDTTKTELLGIQNALSSLLSSWLHEPKIRQAVVLLKRLEVLQRKTQTENTLPEKLRQTISTNFVIGLTSPQKSHEGWNEIWSALSGETQQLILTEIIGSDSITPLRLFRHNILAIKPECQQFLQDYTPDLQPESTTDYILALVKYLKADATKPIIRFSTHTNESIRLCALQSAARLSPKLAGPLATKALEDETIKIRQAALAIISNTKYQPANEKLIAVIESNDFKKKTEDEIKSSFFTLATINPSKTLELINNRIRVNDRISAGSRRTEKIVAIQILPYLLKEKAIPMLEKLSTSFGSSQDSKRAAEIALHTLMKKHDT